MRFKFLFGVLLVCAWAHGQTALEPEQGGIDFKIQGEYAAAASGNAGGLGVQVIALGSGQFKAVFLNGGLPGQGWNGKDRVEASGALQTDKAVFSGNGYTASIPSDGSAITGQTPSGQTFSFSKLMRKSPTQDSAAPAGAIILFNGTGVSSWQDGTASMDARNLLKPEGTSESTGATTKQTFGDFTLHLEFRVPFMPASRGQARGNSGIYLQGRYELQVLDSFGNPFDNGADTMAAKRECGAFFEMVRADLNMAYPPLSWQTYDVAFTAAKFDASGNNLISKAKVTVRWNGVIIHENRELRSYTLLGDPVLGTPGPLRIQFHGDPVYYRNIWVTLGNSSVKPILRPTHGKLWEHAPSTGARWVLPDGRSLPYESVSSTEPRAEVASGVYFFWKQSDSEPLQTGAQ